MRQLLRHCCKAGLLSEFHTGVSRFRFSSTPVAPRETVIIPWRTRPPLFVSQFSLLLCFLLRSSLPSSSLHISAIHLHWHCHSQCHWWPPPAMVLANSLLQGAVACHVTGLYPSQSWLSRRREANKTKRIFFSWAVAPGGLLNLTRRKLAMTVEHSYRLYS